VAINQDVALKVLFTGMHMDYKKEFSLAFGYYCEVYYGNDNTSCTLRVMGIFKLSVKAQSREFGGHSGLKW
jgi:hypothetical protein